MLVQQAEQGVRNEPNAISSEIIQEAQNAVADVTQEAAEEIDNLKRSASDVIQAKSQDNARLYEDKLEMEKRADEDKESKLALQRHFDQAGPRVELMADFDEKHKQQAIEHEEFHKFMNQAEESEGIQTDTIRQRALAEIPSLTLEPNGGRQKDDEIRQLRQEPAKEIDAAKLQGKAESLSAHRDEACKMRQENKMLMDQSDELIQAVLDAKKDSKSNSEAKSDEEPKGSHSQPPGIRYVSRGSRG